MAPSPKHRSPRVRPFTAPSTRVACRYALPVAALGAISLSQIVAPSAAFAADSTTTTSQTAPAASPPATPAPAPAEATAEPGTPTPAAPETATTEEAPAPAAEEPVAEPAPTEAPAPQQRPLADALAPATDLVTDVVETVTAPLAPAPAPAEEAPVGDMQIVLDDYAVQAGSTLSGSVTGVDPDSTDPVTVTITNAAGTTTVTCTVQATSDPGSFTCAVPTGAAPGSTWTATTKQGARSATTSFTIDSATDPAPDQDVAAIDIVQGEDIEITGSGWDPAQPVVITLTGPNGETITVETTPAADGTLTVSAPSGMSTTPGVWTATAKNSSGDLASTTFTVTAYEANPRVNSCGVLHLATSLGATVPLPYDVKGFYPGETATVTIYGPDGQEDSFQITVGDDGSFSNDWSAADKSGTWTVEVTQTSPVAGTTDLRAADNCIVTVVGLPPVDPPGGGGDPTCETDPTLCPVDPPVDPPTCEDDPSLCPPPPPPTCETDPTLCPVVLPPDGTDPTEPSPTDPPLIDTPEIVTITYPEQTDGPTIAPTPEGPSSQPSQTPTPESEKRDAGAGCDDNDGTDEVSDHDRDDDGYCDNEVVDAKFAADEQSWVKEMWLGGLALWGSVLVAGWWFLFGRRRHDDAEG